MLLRTGLAALLLLLTVPTFLAAQERQISGRVTRSGSTDPVPDVEISILNAAEGRTTRTNADGRYSISAPAGDVRLQVRAIGYTRREIAVSAGTSTLDVVLVQDFFRLSEVVVTGQATTVERKSATTAIAYVTGEELSRVAAPTFENALTGKVSGVNLQSNSGAPGGGIQMQIRGNNTILGAFDPLYVIDGIIYSNARIASGRGVLTDAAFATAEDDAVNRVADINPADIASIEILKGAAASSIYGSKAANGVVILTTRRGQQGRPRVRLTQRFGQFTPLKTLESRRYTQAEAVTEYGPSVAQWFTPDANPYFNHYDNVFTGREISWETAADVSGGTENTRYLVGGTFKRDGGIEPSTGFRRQGLRINLDQIVNSRFDVKVSSVFNRSEHDRGWNNNCNNYACHGYAFPYTPSFVDLRRRDADGNYIRPDWGIQSNTVQLTDLAVNHEETNRFTGGATLNYNAITSDRQSLRLILGGGLDAFQQNNDLWAPNELFSEIPQALPGTAIEGDGLSQFFNWNANLVHTFKPAGFWSATTSAGIQYEDRRLQTSRITTSNLVPGQRNVGQGTITTGTENLSAERTIALYGQEEVRLFGERLLVQGGLRAEKSSVNGDIDKYFIFPKISASYRIMNLLGMGSEIKPRFAYGETGNQPLFGQKFTLLGTPLLGGLQGFTVAGASGFPGVEPERVKEIELGLDGFAMNGRMTWEITTFNRNTTNLLLQRVPAPSTGFTSRVFNGGKIKNTGVEVGLGFTPIQRERMQWVSRMTYTTYDSEVLDLAGLPPFRPNLSGFGGLGVTFIRVGDPLTQLIGRGYNADGTRTTATDLQIGNTAPDYRMGFVNDFTFGPWSLNAVLDYQHGGDIINLTQFLYDDAGTPADFGSEAHTVRLKGYNNGVMLPYIEDATFLKLRELSIGVDVPARLFQGLNWGVDDARISLTGRNLWTKADYTGLDPEVANLGSAAIRNNLDVAPYPPSRSIFLNITLGF
ncbi:MAG TPA: SusC/RagA family TonB-linked outer membrane protein [Gemmatimonadaceae bacterium]|nr:SusC/RagA family TonB-linked outer membrane protein [Gemmatimonadaceae bacterium]